VPGKIAILTAVLALCPASFGQRASPVLQGAFTASAGPALYRGKWSARISSATPNAAGGGWILMNEHGDVVLQGTWSARKSAQGWQGTWHARVLRGRAYAGSWTASQPGPNSRSFGDMLQAAMKGAVSGAWRSSGFGGGWRLQPAP
jgi:hypothetical protein